MRSFQILILAFSLFVLQGCATVFTGYYDTVELKDAPDSLRVYTHEGVEIPVEKTTIKVRSAQFENVYEPRLITRIKLRSNADPVLVLSHGAQEKKVQAFGKIQAGWFILDVVFGLPWIVDAITGNWNSYDPIDASFK